MYDAYLVSRTQDWMTSACQWQQGVLDGSALMGEPPGRMLFDSIPQGRPLGYDVGLASNVLLELVAAYTLLESCVASDNA